LHNSPQNIRHHPPSQQPPPKENLQSRKIGRGDHDLYVIDSTIHIFPLLLYAKLREGNTGIFVILGKGARRTFWLRRPEFICKAHLPRTRQHEAAPLGRGRSDLPHFTPGKVWSKEAHVRGCPRPGKKGRLSFPQAPLQHSHFRGNHSKCSRAPLLATVRSERKGLGVGTHGL
jgi:hypothetical protein